LNELHGIQRDAAHHFPFGEPPRKASTLLAEPESHESGFESSRQGKAWRRRRRLFPRCRGLRRLSMSSGAERCARCKLKGSPFQTLLNALITRIRIALMPGSRPDTIPTRTATTKPDARMLGDRMRFAVAVKQFIKKRNGNFANPSPAARRSSAIARDLVSTKNKTWYGHPVYSSRSLQHRQFADAFTHGDSHGVSGDSRR